jgi:glycosyltransferase involved in cell wall biosynthesis
VTTYNRPDALERTLEGLGMQDRVPGQVLVADDGSTTDTADLVRRWSAEAPFPLHHVWHEDRGFRAAAIRNKAIRESSGAYIVFLDGDCVPDRYFIGDHLDLALPGRFFQGKRVILGPRWAGTFRAGNIRTGAGRLRMALSSQVGNRHHLVRLPLVPAVTSTSMSGIRSCNMGIFRTDLEAVNGFNEDFVGWGREDSELAVRLYRYGLKRLGHPFRAICYHLWHPEQERSRLLNNDELLSRQTVSTEVSCEHGLVHRRNAGA